MGPRTIADLKNWPGWIWVLNLSGTSSWFRYSFISESKIFQLDWPSANRKPGMKNVVLICPRPIIRCLIRFLSFHIGTRNIDTRKETTSTVYSRLPMWHSTLPDHLIFKVATIALLQLSSYHLVNQLGLHHSDTSFTTRNYCTWFFLAVKNWKQINL